MALLAVAAVLLQGDAVGHRGVHSSRSLRGGRLACGVGDRADGLVDVVVGEPGIEALERRRRGADEDGIAQAVALGGEGSAGRRYSRAFETSMAGVSDWPGFVPIEVERVMGWGLSWLDADFAGEEDGKKSEALNTGPSNTILVLQPRIKDSSLQSVLPILVAPAHCVAGLGSVAPNGRLIKIV